jgi:hypothetical protein
MSQCTWDDDDAKPQQDCRRPLRCLRLQLTRDTWPRKGDFNLILSAEEKSNSNLNRRLMGSFKSVIDDLELRELPLKGRKFTWSNDVTHTRIDRGFCTAEWDLMLPNCALQAVSSLVSDHCPLLLVGNATVRKYRGLRFEVFWPKLQGYQELVSAEWAKPTQVFNPYLNLHIKLQRLGKKLQRWARSKIGNNVVLLHAARKLIAILDVVQEFRQLSEEEIRPKRDVKARFLGLTAIEKLCAKQLSRLTYIKAAEAHYKPFFLQLNGRRRKNHIQTLLTPEGLLHTHEDKQRYIF